MRKLSLIAVAILLPLAASAGLDIVEVTASSVTDSNEVTASSSRAVDGKVVAVHVEVTPTSGTWTNTVTLSTTANRGVSFADNAILTLSDLNATTNYVYYPRYVVDGSTGVDVVATNGWYTPFYLVQDILKVNTTNTSLASTNDVTVRVVIEN